MGGCAPSARLPPPLAARRDVGPARAGNAGRLGLFLLDWMGAYGYALALLGALYHRERNRRGPVDRRLAVRVGFVHDRRAAILDWSANGREWRRMVIARPTSRPRPRRLSLRGPGSLGRHRLLHRCPNQGSRRWPSTARGSTTGASPRWSTASCIRMRSMRAVDRGPARRPVRLHD